jgi:Tol biopolymer transport system component
MSDQAEVREELDRIATSAGFVHSPRMTRFLRFVVEESSAGRASELKEYVVGVRVFDKAESFDPSIDPTVRVEAAKLRAKLTRYYETEGRSDAVVIDIPKGHYCARFRIRTEAERPLPIDRDVASTPRASPRAPSRVFQAGVGALSMREILAWGLVVTFGLAALLVLARVGVQPPSHPVFRFHLYPPDQVRIGDLRTYGPAVISPDGRRLAFVGLDPQGRSTIWVRDVDKLAAVPIGGTQGASYPFWSPDASQIVYFADGKLKKVRIDGGVPDVLADAPLGRSGTWSTGETILFVRSPASPLQIASAGGGDRLSLAAVPDKTANVAHLHPLLLPDGHRFFFIETQPTAASGVPLVGELGTTRRPMRYSPIAETHSNVAYAASENDASRGYLLYVRSSALMAQPVDVSNLAPRGEARLVATGVRSSLERWRGDFSASLNGVLVYRATGRGGRTLAWYDRRGNKLGDVSGSGSHRDVALSPDATLLAVHRFESSPNWSDIWIQDLARGTESRLTLAGSPHYTPVWARDGQGLFFVARRADGFGLYYCGLSERHPRELLKSGDDFIAVSDASPDGRSLLYQTRTAAGHFDLWLLELAENPHATPFLRTPFDEVEGQFSPDGRWLAYVSTEAAKPEVYVSARESPAARVQVSANGGIQPRWRRDGRELFYVGIDGRLMSATVGPGTLPRLSAPVALFQTHIDARSGDALQHFDYDISSDGQRIITLAAPEVEAVTPWTVVINWPALLNATTNGGARR